MISIFSRRIEYDGNVRGGTVTYIDGDVRIKFDYEMGGGDCIFYIMIPSEKDWEKTTMTPLSKREDILQFVADTVKRDQASSSRVVIDYDQITFYRS